MWSAQQVAVVISLIVTNCLIQISCSITSNRTSSAVLIDNIAVDDSNNNSSHNGDKGETYIEELVSSKLSQSAEVLEFSDFAYPCSCETTDENCYNQCSTNDDDFGNSLSNMFLVTAGEVLLGCAIIMGLSAVVTMMIRVCSRSRLSQRARDNPDLIDALENNGARGSLTSLQQSVVAKMRDRPPRYETRHNYEYRRRETSEGDEPCCAEGAAAASIRNVAVLNPGASRVNEPPPPYDSADSNSVHELPPAYTINLSTDDCCRDDANQGECVGGIPNQSFTCDERCQRGNDSRASANGNCDNTLHI